MATRVYTETHIRVGATALLGATLTRMSDQSRIDRTMLGKRVVNLRQGRQMEQADVAEAAKLSRSYVSRLENGLIANPKVFDLEQIAAALGVSLAELVAPETRLAEIRYSADWAEIQEQTEHLRPDVRESVLRGFRQSIEIARAADPLARRN